MLLMTHITLRGEVLPKVATDVLPQDLCVYYQIVCCAFHSALCACSALGAVMEGEPFKPLSLGQGSWVCSKENA